MIFYTAIAPDGGKKLAGTQADARAINRDFDQIDIPTDKAGLMAFVQELYDHQTQTPTDLTPSEDIRMRMGQCPGCARTPIAAAHFAENDIVIELSRIIGEVPDRLMLELFEAFTDRYSRMFSLPQQTAAADST